jgi:hypothetical protein
VIDPLEQAQDYEQRDREAALRAHQARIADSHAPRDPHAQEWCCDCAKRIEPERLASLGRWACRCAACARRFAAEVAARNRNPSCRTK